MGHTKFEFLHQRYSGALALFDFHGMWKLFGWALICPDTMGVKHRFLTTTNQNQESSN